MHLVPKFLVGATSPLLAFVEGLLDDERPEIPVDASSLRFATPAGICVLACTSYRLRARGQQIVVHGLSPDIESYLDRMDLLSHCNLKSSAPRNRYPHPDSLVELRRLDSAKDAPDVAHQLAQALTGMVMEGIDDREDPEGMQPKLSDRVWHPLHYVLSELLENAVTHAKGHGYKDSSVWVAANYYRQSGLVRLGVVDNGCGFLTSLRRHERVRNEPTDFQAIAAALEPFVSGNPEVGILDSTSNQGIGLTVSRDIAVAARGYVEITSGDTTMKNAPERSKSHPVRWEGAILDVCLLRKDLLSLDLKTFIAPYAKEPVPELRFE